MKNRNFFLPALLALSVTFLVAFSGARSETNVTYEYTSVIYANFGIVISQQGKEIVRVKTKLNDSDNFTPVFDIINKYEAAGWELFANNMTMVPDNSTQRNYFLLRRKK